MLKIICAILLTLNTVVMASELTTEDNNIRQVKLNKTELNNIHKLALSIHNQSFQAKVLTFSQYFIGKPYSFSKEEEIIRWDAQKQLLELLDFNQFDCITYVEMVLALATMPIIPPTEEEFAFKLAENLADIMFNSMPKSYITRNHFIDSEWLPHNRRFIGVNPLSNSPYVKQKTANINKAGLLGKQIENYSKKFITEEERLDFESNYKVQIKQFVPKVSKIEYISFKDFLNAEKELTELLKGKIYLLAVIMDHPKMLELTNSEHNVGHVGLVISKDDTLYLRHATSIGSKEVEEILLADFAKRKEDSKIFLGFALFEIITK